MARVLDTFVLEVTLCPLPVQEDKELRKIELLVVCCPSWVWSSPSSGRDGRFSGRCWVVGVSDVFDVSVESDESDEFDMEDSLITTSSSVLFRFRLASPMLDTVDSSLNAHFKCSIAAYQPYDSLVLLWL